MKFDPGRQFYIRVPACEFESRPLPAVFTNAIKKKANIECQTLDLIKFNQKIKDCEIEILQQC
jgi:DNA mismatch repair protein MSH4